MGGSRTDEDSGYYRSAEQKDEEGSTHMAPRDVGERGELILTNDEYILVQDRQDGSIKTIVGGRQLSLSSSEIPIVWDFEKKRYVRFPTNAKDAVRTCPVTPEGFYLELLNPSADGQIPVKGTDNQLPPLQIGKKVNIPGPDERALWPGQHARIIRGHRLRSNQYLIVEIYNDTESTKNWSRAVVKAAAPIDIGKLAGDLGPAPKSGDKSTEITVAQVTAPAPFGLTVGQRLVIKGTEVSFYIPPTGVKVVPDENGKQVRNAVTLERLEYCILLAENGNKRYVKGPEVVFPDPTEQFVTKDGSRKWPAVDLNKNSGVHVEVIESYEENGEKYEAGQELFLTGGTTPIYFPRKEHRIIRYGNEDIHFAVAVPESEGRYVLDKDTGVIATLEGPSMLLPDPIHEVIVQRILPQRQVKLWYPGNEEAALFNAQMASIQDTGLDYVESDTSRNMRSSSVSRGGKMAAKYRSAPALEGLVAADMTTSYSMRNVEQVGEGIAGDEVQRRTSFTPPRTLTLNTKYDGVPSISPFVGYAVLVTDKKGNRRVVIGPNTIRLKYDEVLQVLALSTGKPKNTDRLFRTVYLQIKNNKVSDVIEVETADKCKINIKVSYRVHFEGEEDGDRVKWFDVENYVKLLSDHARSLLRNAAKHHSIEKFYNEGIDIVRDVLLGAKPEGGERPGLAFDENNMRVYDVEVLSLQIEDAHIDELLSKVQRDSVKAVLDIQAKEQELEHIKRSEIVSRLTADTIQESQKQVLARETENVELQAELAELRGEKSKKQEELQAALVGLQQSVIDIDHASALARDKASDEMGYAMEKANQSLRIEEAEKMAATVVAKAEAIHPDLIAALQRFGDDHVLANASKAIGPMTLLGGESFVEILQRIFTGTAMGSTVTSLLNQAVVNSADQPAAPTAEAARRQ